VSTDQIRRVDYAHAFREVHCFGDSRRTFPDSAELTSNVRSAGNPKANSPHLAPLASKKGNTYRFHQVDSSP